MKTTINNVIYTYLPAQGLAEAQGFFFPAQGLAEAHGLAAAQGFFSPAQGLAAAQGFFSPAQGLAAAQGLPATTLNELLLSEAAIALLEKKAVPPIVKMEAVAMVAIYLSFIILIELKEWF